MHHKIDKVYLPSDLTQYSFKDRFLIHFADWAFYLLIRAIGSTVRFQTIGAENLKAVDERGQLPIYAVWHDRIFLGTYFFRHRGIVYLTSKSFDGEYIARFLQRFGFGAVRGSSTRGGAAGLVEMIHKMRAGLPMGFTTDGPKGPRYWAKTGAVLLAKKTGNPIIPFIIESQNRFTVKSWDRLQIPRPFTRAAVLFGPPIYVDEKAPGSDIESHRAELQKSLDDLVTQGEVWRAGLDGGSAAS